MSRLKILFSVLRYKLITNENINIGILFHNLDTDERKLETITKWSRLKNFDDEVDIKFFKIMLQGMKEEIQNTLFNDLIEFNIKEYTKKFYNEMRFSQIYEDETDDFKEFIQLCKKNFLRYDLEKKDRPSKDQQVGYMKRLMKANEVVYSVKSPKGNYNEKIYFDYIIGEYAFKFFSFENKKLDILIHTAKAWAYTALELKKQYKTIFVYDVEVKDKKFDTIISILKSNADKVIKYDDTLDFVLNRYNKEIN
ncbi:DUF3037 domain-containing protein [Clostridium botulinum]|nr:DUF3037 domain-containing protein [Clostridium botulinum]NFO67530.1 DUF3037 domain-containing protein [Clostridium botulinum]